MLPIEQVMAYVGTIVATLVAGLVFLFKWILSIIDGVRQELTHCKEAHALQGVAMLKMSEELGELKGRMAEAERHNSPVIVADILKGVSDLLDKKGELMSVQPQYTVYIDRTLGTIKGVLTLQKTEDGKVTKLFDRLPITSGQYPFTDGGAEDWVQGKGPTPMGVHYLSTKRETLHMSPGGPFYVLSTRPGERIIWGPNGKKRENAGIHLENQYPGTAGCTALENNKPRLQAEAMRFFTFLDWLYSEGIHYVKCVVL